MTDFAWEDDAALQRQALVKACRAERHKLRNGAKVCQCGYRKRKTRRQTNKVKKARSKAGKAVHSSYRPFKMNPDLAREAGIKGNVNRTTHTFSKNPDVARRAQRQSAISRMMKRGTFPPKPRYSWRW